MFYYLNAAPAYGRVYKTIQHLLEDWNNGKDFKLSDTGQYFSIRDLLALRRDGVIGINFRNNKEIYQIDIAF